MINTTMLSQIASVLLCKTHRWLLLAQCNEHLYWCSNDASVKLPRSVERKELDFMLAHAGPDQDANFKWSLSAVTEPAWPEEEVHKAVDFLFLSKDGPIAKELTPRGVLQCMLNYSERTLRMVGVHAHFRGFPEMSPILPEGLTMPDPVMAARHDMLLCSDEIAYGARVETHAERDKYLWWSRGISELLPCYYYQRIIADKDGIMHYMVAAPESLEGANVVFNAELAAFSAYVPRNQKDAALLHRAISVENKEYVDLTLNGSAKKTTDSLRDLNHRLVTLSNYAKRMAYQPITLDNSSKKELLRLHREDALAPITNHAWSDLE